MCLGKVVTTQPAKSGVAYKVFSREKNGDLYAPSYPVRVHPTQWNDGPHSDTTLHDLVGYAYPCGYHMFKDRDAAEAAREIYGTRYNHLARRWQYDPVLGEQYCVCRVEYQEATAEGVEIVLGYGTATAVVARKMKVLNFEVSTLEIPEANDVEKNVLSDILEDARIEG